MLTQFLTALGTLLKNFPVLLKTRRFAFLLAALVLVAALSLLFLQGCMLKAQELEIEIQPSPNSQESSDMDQKDIPSDDTSWTNSVGMMNGQNPLLPVILSSTKNIFSLCVRMEHTPKSLRERMPSSVFKWKNGLRFVLMEVPYEKA